MQRRREPAGGLGKKERNTLRLRELAVGRAAGALLLLALEWHLRSESDPVSARVTITRRPLRALKVTLRPQYLAICYGPSIPSRGLPAEPTTLHYAVSLTSSKPFPLSGSP
jgi:hypothetical protein